jgi:hypothetical protein
MSSIFDWGVGGNDFRAKALVIASKMHREKCQAEGTRYEFDFGAFIDELYPHMRICEPKIYSDIMGKIYELLNK